MKSRITLIILAVIIILICVIGIYCSENPKVGSFSLDEYTDFIEQFPTDVAYGEIKTAQQAKNAAKEIWRDIYGNSVIYLIPYRVYYDEINQVWLVRGSTFFMIPSGPYAIISAEDGKVLAAWHEKF